MGEPLKSRSECPDLAALERRSRAAYKALVEYRLWCDGEQASAEAELWDELRLAETAARRESDTSRRLLATVEARERALARLRDLLGPPRLRRYSVEELTEGRPISNPEEGER
jgi:hypothetical protein